MGIMPAEAAIELQFVHVHVSVLIVTALALVNRELTSTNLSA